MSGLKTNGSVAISRTPKKTEERSPNILVVDDDPVLLDLFDKVLKKLGFQVVLSASGKDALNLVRKASPDVVLLDIKMPGMDGITALKEIKTLDPDIEIVIMTGYASLDTAIEALKYGAFDYIKKPFDKLEVANAILRAWERRKPRLEGQTLKASQERNIYELKVLYNTSRILGNCLDHQEMVCQLLDSLKRIADYEMAAVILTDKSDQRELLVQVVKPSSFSLVEEVKRNLIDAFNAVSRSKIPSDLMVYRILGEENIKDENQPNGPAAKELSYFLNIPMLKEGSLIGMINLSSHRDRAFSADHIGLVYAIVSQVSKAMQRLNGIKAAERSRVDKLAQNMTDGVIIVDEIFEVVLVNPVAQKIIGSSNLTLEPIQNVLGIDLRKLKTQMEKEQLDLVKQEVKIDSNNYHLSISIIQGAAKSFMGYVISLYKFSSENKV